MDTALYRDIAIFAAVAGVALVTMDFVRDVAVGEALEKQRRRFERLEDALVGITRMRTEKGNATVQRMYRRALVGLGLAE